MTSTPEVTMQPCSGCTPITPLTPAPTIEAAAMALLAALLDQPVSFDLETLSQTFGAAAGRAAQALLDACHVAETAGWPAVPVQNTTGFEALGT